ncbi:N-acyl homoserine lactonase family protein [soil metagenome]
MLPTYELLAIRYATAHLSPDHIFLRADPHEVAGPIDYFVWLIRGEGRTILVDTGFGPEQAAARGRTLLRSPAEALAALGVPADTIDTVVLTHLHYDHAGNIAMFPNANFIVQAGEIAGATGRDMQAPICRAAFAVEDVLEMIRRLFADRARLVEGDTELAPGITLHLLGGHTRGLQGVRVHTERGWVMLASDALHFYANLTRANPFPVLVDLPGVILAGRKALALAGSLDKLIPGHDPAVTKLYPEHTEVADVFDLSAPLLIPVESMLEPRG